MTRTHEHTHTRTGAWGNGGAKSNPVADPAPGYDSDDTEGGPAPRAAPPAAAAGSKPAKPKLFPSIFSGGASAQNNAVFEGPVPPAVTVSVCSQCVCVAVFEQQLRFPLAAFPEHTPPLPPTPHFF